MDNALELIPVLNIIGIIIKNSTKIPNKYIPLILLAFGIIGAISLMGFSVGSILQGIMITGTAVYGNQVVKQMQKKDEN